jgi:hypothetical protein
MPELDCLTVAWLRIREGAATPAHHPDVVFRTIKSWAYVNCFTFNDSNTDKMVGTPEV